MKKDCLMQSARETKTFGTFPRVTKTTSGLYASKKKQRMSLQNSSCVFVKCSLKAQIVTKIFWNKVVRDWGKVRKHKTFFLSTQKMVHFSENKRYVWMKSVKWTFEACQTRNLKKVWKRLFSFWLWGLMKTELSGQLA